MSWADQLERASFAGVEFHCQSVDDDLSRRLTEHKYPYRNGSDVEDMGRAARTTTLRAIFINGTADDVGYEARLGEFLRVVDSGKRGLFQHPLLGSWQAKARRFPIRHDGAARDMAHVDVEFIEDGTDTALPDLFSVSKAQADVIYDCDVVVAEYTALDAAIDGLSEMVADARDFANTVTSAVQNAVDRVNVIRAGVLKAIATAKKLGDVGSWPIVSACKRLVRSTIRLGRAVQSLAPPVVLHNLETNMSLTMLSQGLYGDGARAAQLLQLNHVRNPFVIRAGTQLKVYGK